MKFATFFFAVLALAGCQNKNPDPTLEAFFPEDVGETRKPNQFADLMAASGARSDATLYSHHFDGAKLNSLGEQKLTLMLSDDDAPAPMTVYLDLNEKEAVSKQRQTAVVAFLKDKGLTDQQIEVLYGDNPSTRTPAAPGIADVGKTDTGSGPGATVGSAQGSQGSQGGSAGAPPAAGDAGSSVSASTSAK